MNKVRLNELFTPSGMHLNDHPDAIPWDVYPRPKLKRDSFINLNGWWDFTVSDSESAPTAYDRRIRVPFCPESLLSGVDEVFPNGSSLWYRREFILPQGFQKDRVLLHVGAVDQYAYVYVNGSFVGEHVGGYAHFTFDITDHLQERNVLEIRAVDQLADACLPYGKQRYKRGGMWYTPVSGIWQTVWLESVPAVYVNGLTVEHTEDGVVILVDGVTDGVVTVKTDDGHLMVPLQEGRAEVSLADPRWWSPDDPFLYEYTVETAEDTVTSYFALRTLDVRHVDDIPRMCLNGKPIFLHAVLDQGYWSDGLFTPAAPDDYERDILQMKNLGFNTLRKHIKIEADQFYYDCDRLGMLVWQDMVNNGRYSFLRDTALPTIGMKRLNDKGLHRDKNVRKSFEAGMRQTVCGLKDYSCIVGWTIFNEGWGQFDSQRMYDLLKLLDPTRFVDTASGWFKGADSDVVSEHVYFKPYRFVPGDKPVFLSEFGGYSYKPDDHVFNTEKTYGYRLFNDAEKYMDGLEWLYLMEIVPAVKQGLCGAVYTQLSDVEDETNGLVSYDRRICKVNENRMLDIASALYREMEVTE